MKSQTVLFFFFFKRKQKNKKNNMYLLNHSTAGKYENKKIVLTAVVLCKMIYTFFCNRYISKSVLNGP